MGCTPKIRLFNFSQSRIRISLVCTALIISLIALFKASLYARAQAVFSPPLKFSGKVSKPIVNEIQALSDFSAYDTNVDFVGRIVYDENGVETINFGKNKGVPVEKVLREQPGYYGWILNNEFPLYTKKVLTAIKLRMK